MSLANPRRRPPPGYGQGQVTLSAAQLLQCDPTEVTRRLVETFRSDGYEPPMLPRTATEIMSLAGHPDTTFPQVAEALKSDPMLAGKVMQTAQSPLYAGRVKPRNLDDAIARLGIKGLMNLVLDVSLNLKVFRSAHYSEVLASVHRHSQAVAHISQAIAPRFKVDPNEAFTAGLLHDVGIAGGLLVLGQRVRGSTPPALETFWYSIEAAHVEGSNALCKFWGVPTLVRLAVAIHHDPRVKQRFHGPASVLCLANHLAHEVGLGIASPPADVPVPTAQSETLSPRALAAVQKGWRFDDKVMQRFVAKAEKVAETLNQ